MAKALELTQEQFKMLCGLHIPFILLHAIDYVCQMSNRSFVRDLDVLDVFAGYGGIFAAARRAGLRASVYDKEKKRQHDISTTTGFFVYLQYILRCRVGALVFAGVPCSSLVWISRSATNRSREAPLGDSSKPATKRGNMVACRWALGILLAIVRQVLWGAEQPGSSLLHRLPFVKFLLQINLYGMQFPAGSMARFWMGGYGARTLKRTLVIGNVPWMSSLAEYRNLHQTQKHTTDFDSTGVVNRKRRRDGSVAVTGGPKLAQTQAYPSKFCRRIIGLQMTTCVAPSYEPAVPEIEDLEEVPVNLDIWSYALLEPIVEFLKEEAGHGRWTPKWPLPLSDQPAEIVL